MLSFLKKSPKEEVTLCVSVVTSYSVSASVVRVYRRADSVVRPVVLFSCEELIPSYHDHDAAILESLTFLAGKKALEQCRSFHGNFDKLVCTLGEPWVTSMSRTSHLEKNDPFVVNQKLIDDLVLRESRLFEQEVIRDYQNQQEVGIVGISDVVVDLNGYRTPVIARDFARSVDVHLTFSLAPASFVEGVIGMFADVFHRTDVFVSSIDTALPMLFSQPAKATVLALGGLTSAISVVDHGHATHHISVPGGLSDLEVNIQDLFDIDRRQVLSVMQFATDENILAHHRDVYYRRIEAAYRDLGVAVRRGILHLKRHTESVPEPVYAIGNCEWLTVLQALLEKDTETSLTVLPSDVLDDRIIYTHDASVKNISLSLAILQAVKNSA